MAHGLPVSVRPGSPAARAGMPAVVRLCRLNGQLITDELDYLFYSAGTRVTVELAPGSRPRRFRIDKEYDEDAGLVLPAMCPRRCGNNCLFCFMTQLPPGSRSGLRVRDEDYRFSFLYGNYITLTNLTEQDWRRIAALRLSPLYVSVHATSEAMRRRLLGRHRVPPIMKQLRRLAATRIALHAQVVLCPGLNDGDVLERTLTDLEQLYPWVQSVALVPVGLTRYRAGLPQLAPYSAAAARRLVREMLARQRDYRRRWGEGWLYLADEFFFLAGVSLPPNRYYDDYAQIENGVGMARRLLGRLHRRRPSGPRPYYALTGELAAGLIAPWARRHRVSVLPVKNRYLGTTINVAGLLAGRDLARELKKITRGTVYVPASALNRDAVFIDDLPLAALRRVTRARIRLVDDEGRLVTMPGAR